MASLPKKVFEHFSRGIIHKNEIYVYLFMTFTIKLTAIQLQRKRTMVTKISLAEARNTGKAG
jgi:hypothetical protein